MEVKSVNNNGQPQRRPQNPQSRQGQPQRQPQSRQGQPQSQPQRPSQPQRQPRPQGNSSGINISYNTVCLVLCLVFALVNFKVFSMIITSNDTLKTKIAIPDVSIEQQKEKERQEALKKDIEENFVPLAVTYEDTKKGNLILVDPNHAYSFDTVATAFSDPDAVTIPDAKHGEYWVKSNYDLLKPEALSAVDSLLCAFNGATGDKNVMILDTHRTFEDQERVLNNKIGELGEEQGRKIATEPGHSEHHTALAIDFTLFNGSEYATYDGTGVYQWITDNCPDYGFVIRYPADKTDITGITYEPWHLRYVGKGHASFMTQNGLCLEEYIQYLSRYTVDGERLKFSDADGVSYTVYTCAVPQEGTTVLVPKNGLYTLSGDNDGRIIVTCSTSY